LIGDSVISGNVGPRDGEETQRSQSIVDLDNDNVLSRSKLTPITGRIGTGTSRVSRNGLVGDLRSTLAWEGKAFGC